jgi:hypothetical protein
MNVTSVRTQWKLILKGSERKENFFVAVWESIWESRGTNRLSVQLNPMTVNLFQGKSYNFNLGMLQWSHEFKNMDQMISNHSEGDCTALWIRCQEAFREAGVSPGRAVDFFKEQSEKASSYKER